VYQVPSSLAGLLSLLRGCFTQPSFATFSMLVVKAGPIRLAVDDTLFGRSGRKVFGAHYLHDGAQPEGSGRRTRWGNCWVVVVLVVELPCLGGRQVGLPVLLGLFGPKDEAHPELDAQRPSQPELARTLIEIVLERFPTRIVEVVCDGAYASKAWQAQPERVSVTTRMRANAAVYALPGAGRRPGQQGRTPLTGAKLQNRREDRRNGDLHAGHDHRPQRTRAHGARPRVHLPVVQAISHAAREGDPDP
jgi:hypothetical protein